MNKLEYPKRRYGNDHDLYDWSYSQSLKADQSNNKLHVFIVIPLEFFPLDPSGKPFKHPGAMATPYPDLRHYTTRDYGNRVGVFRILDALDTAGVKAVFPVNAVLLERYRVLIEVIKERGHEIAAHGWSTDHIHSSILTKEEEWGLIEKTKKMFEAFGLLPKTWMSPARNQSYATPELLARAGYSTCLDWEMDQVPVSLNTSNGGLKCLPLLNELSDFNILINKKQTEREWADQVLEAVDYLAKETPSRGARYMGFTLTPYVAGLPFRVAQLNRLLACLSQTSDTVVELPINMD